MRITLLPRNSSSAEFPLSKDVSLIFDKISLDLDQHDNDTVKLSSKGKAGYLLVQVRKEGIALTLDYLESFPLFCVIAASGTFITDNLPEISHELRVKFRPSRSLVSNCLSRCALYTKPISENVPIYRLSGAGSLVLDKFARKFVRMSVLKPMDLRKTPRRSVNAVIEQLSTPDRSVQLLSGGLDSSMLAQILREKSQQSLRHSVYLNFTEANYGDELADASFVAAHTTTSLQVLDVTSADLIVGGNDVVTVAPGLGSIRRGVTSKLYSIAADRECSTILSGNGGDQIFGAFTETVRRLSSSAGLRQYLIELMTEAVRTRRSIFSVVFAQARNMNCIVDEIRLLNWETGSLIDGDRVQENFFANEQWLPCYEPVSLRSPALDRDAQRKWLESRGLGRISVKKFKGNQSDAWIRGLQYHISTVNAWLSYGFLQENGIVSFDRICAIVDSIENNGISDFRELIGLVSLESWLREGAWTW